MDARERRQRCLGWWLLIPLVGLATALAAVAARSVAAGQADLAVIAGVAWLALMAVAARMLWSLTSW